MTTPAFTLSIQLGADTMKSGDDVAAALRNTADHIASRFDGLTIAGSYAEGAIHDDKGQTVGTWAVEA